MDKQRLVEILRSDQDKWPEIKALHSNDLIDLTSTDLRDIKFNNLDLKSIDFSNSNLSKSSFVNCDLSGSVFNSAELSWITCTQSVVKYITVSEVDLYSAQFNGVNLSGSEFHRSNLSNVRFKDCVLEKCDFRWSTLTGAMLDSRAQLKGLIHFLSDEQLSGIIFSDEIRNEKQARNESDIDACLEVHVDGDHITPFNLSYLLLALEGVYNNLLYLSQTESDSLEEIRRNIFPYYQGVGSEEAIQIRAIKEGSIIIDLVAPTAAILLTLAKSFQIISQQVLEHKRLASEEREGLANIERTKAETERVRIDNLTIMKDVVQNSEHVNSLVEVGSDTSVPVDYSDICSEICLKNKLIDNNKEELIEKGMAPLENILFKYEKMGIAVTSKYNSNRSAAIS